MDVEQVVRETIERSVPNPLDTSQDSRTGEDAHTSLNPVGDAVSLIPQTYSGSTGVERLAVRAEGLLQSGELQGGVHVDPLPSGPHLPAMGGPATSQKSLSGPSFVIEEAIESSAGNPIALVGNVANAAAIGSTGDIKDQAQALVLARMRSVVSVYAAKLPIVGSYFIDTKHIGEPNVSALATETTPLLGALHDPKAFATEQAEGLLRRLFAPLLNRLPDVDALDNVDSDNYGPLFKIFVECYILARDGCGWLL